MANVILQGMARRRQEFTLSHEIYCEKSGDCKCEEITVRTIVHDRKSGMKLPKVVTRKVPGVVVVPFRSMVSIHESVLDCPGVDAAIRAKPARIRIRRG